MRNKLLLVILLLITCLACGCNKVADDKLLRDGQEKLESHQYDEALSILSQVIDADSDNESARAMYMQARKMKSAEMHEKNGDYTRAIADLEMIVNIDNGSKKIKRESANKKSELEKLEAEREKEALAKKANAKQVSKKAMAKLDSEIYQYIETEDSDDENTENDSDMENGDTTTPSNPSTPGTSTPSSPSTPENTQPEGGSNVDAANI